MEPDRKHRRKSVPPSKYMRHRVTSAFLRLIDLLQKTLPKFAHQDRFAFGRLGAGEAGSSSSDGALQQQGLGDQHDGLLTLSNRDLGGAGGLNPWFLR